MEAVETADDKQHIVYISHIADYSLDGVVRVAGLIQ